MIHLRKDRFKSFLKDVQIEVENHNCEQFFSYTEKINPLSMIQVFKALEHKRWDRFFWTNNTHTFKLFGIGISKQIKQHHHDDKKWNVLWDDFSKAAIINSEVEILGTGLVAFGGMTFDPLKKGTKLWRNFPDHLLTVPKFLFTKVRDSYYFSINHYMEPGTDVDSIVAEVEQLNTTIKQHSTEKKTRLHRLIKKNEVESEQWLEAVEKGIQSIQDSHMKKVVLARELRLHFDQRVHIGHALEKLINSQPESYIFAYEQGEDCFMGASPERLLYIEGEHFLSTCLAGTIPRHKEKATDEKMAQSLYNDPKNREEHDHVVQMIRENIQDLCKDIVIPNRPEVLTLPNLHHLYTPVQARLKDQVSAFHFIESLHPTPALGGVPTNKALSFIRKEELLDRGWYGAPIGWIDRAGNSEFAVAIRSGLIQGDEASLFSGCGIMRDSDPDVEYEETNVKFLPMLTVLED